MDYKILWDSNVILDLLLSRTKDNPYIFEIEKYVLNYKIPIYISSSQLQQYKNYSFGAFKKFKYQC
jgi:hypothetical protein